MIYEESTREPVSSPDLDAGYVYDGVLVTGYTEARTEVLPGTVTEARPAGLRHLVPPQAITEPCQYYHKYTEEELAAQHPPDETDGSNLAARVEELETRKANQTDVDELQEALDMILSGVTE